ncbi:hypothetical protein GCM10011374_20160 [Kocuria dechangensis]|uniref:MFS transporter n=1 Tax=Kocuria dechangensis TaxID=1176249 RepID=A0A917GV30_9MICC|nr:hypothetical protein [Kocuria dechangensis]GGG57318.1 hypothetical protein GCM10011374_20160 [Kocuria dechangensis]
MTTTRPPEPLGWIPAPVDRSPLADSRQLAAVSGALFPVLTLLVRLPQTLLPLGVLTAVSLASGSPALGTLCAGAVTLGSAVCGLAMGAAASWRGRKLGLLLIGILNPLAVWWLVRVLTQTPGAELDAGFLVPCLLAGLVQPQMGVVCRLRWRTILTHSHHEDLFDTALRHESVMESVATVSAATVAGVVAVTLGPAAVPVLSAAVTVAGTAIFLTHFSAGLPPVLVHILRRAPRERTRAARQHRRRLQALQVLPVIGMAATGSLLGSILGSVVVFASSVDTVVSVSWLYAVTGLTSALTAVLASVRAGVVRLWNRWVACAAASVLAAMLLSIPDESSGMVLVLALAGLTVGPCLVAVYEIAGLVVPSSQVTLLTTVMTSAMSIGLTVGLVLSGWSGASLGYRTAALVPVASAVVCLAAALRFVHRWRRTLPVRD